MSSPCSKYTKIWSNKSSNKPNSWTDGNSKCDPEYFKKNTSGLYLVWFWDRPAYHIQVVKSQRVGTALMWGAGKADSPSVTPMAAAAPRGGRAMFQPMPSCCPDPLCWSSLPAYTKSSPCRALRWRAAAGFARPWTFKDLWQVLSSWTSSVSALHPVLFI